MSCVQENVFEQRYLLGTEAKVQLAQCGFSEDEISEDEHIIHATIEMDKGLENLISALSLISMALLELGVIVEYEEGEDESEINS